MSFLNKLMFWKRDDEINFDSLANDEINNGMPLRDNLGLDQKPAGLNEQSPFEDTPSNPVTPMQQQNYPYGNQQPFSTPNPGQTQQTQAALRSRDRDLELINSKLDTLKAILTSLDQRVGNIERTTGADKKHEKLW